MSTPAANAASAVFSPPNVVMVSTSQYRVPQKYTAPVVRPRAKARRGGCGRWDSATSRGASASQANAGCPNFGKLSASSAPERSARRKSNAGSARADERLELLVSLEAAGCLLRVVLVGVAADLDAIDAWSAS